MSNEPEVNLEFVSDQALIEELKSRHDASLIVLYRMLSDEQDETFTDYSGGLPTCIGLAERVKARLLSRALSKDEK